jgi:hypothetical protein
MMPVLIPEDQVVVATAEDAYRAALASILAVELEQVPMFEGLAAELEFQAWLGGKLNLACLKFASMDPPTGYWIARIRSPYDFHPHTVVMRYQQVVHDPHPAQKVQPGVEGLTVLQCELLVPLDPSLPAGTPALAG